MSPPIVQRATHSLASAAAIGWVLGAPAVLAAPDMPCGLQPNDWCPAAASDPCGAHRAVEACRADTTCFGMPYRGESVVACARDARGFGINCPTVGCTSDAPR